MTSLNGPGFSLTLLAATDLMLHFLDASTDAIGWPVPVLPTKKASAIDERILSRSDEMDHQPELAPPGGLQS
jgi:dihydroxyacetone kinase